MATKAYSLWVYDRHCTLIYHHDWSLSSSSSTLLQPGPDLLPGVSRSILPQSINTNASSSSTPAQPTTSSSTTTTLALTDQAKLIYGLVFSLRNMLSKLSTSSQSSQSSQFHTYSTPTYSLGHYQTASMYTFVILTDPVSPPVRLVGSGGGGGRPLQGGNNNGTLGGSSGFNTSSDSSTSALPATASSSGGGGIPGTGGMSLPGVLKQIISGPWVEWVVKNAAMDLLGGGLEMEEMYDVDLDEEGGGESKEEEEREEEEEVSRVRGVVQRATRRRGVDSDGFKASVEAVLTQNKLSIVHPPMQKAS